jgi:hypothetical protein
MSAHSVLAYLLHPGSNKAHVAAVVREVEETMRLVPRTAADELPPYRGQPMTLDGWRRRERSITDAGIKAEESACTMLAANSKWYGGYFWG